MKKAGVRNLRGDKQEIEGDLILKEGKVYVLRDKKLRIEIIQLHYDRICEENEKSTRGGSSGPKEDTGRHEKTSRQKIKKSRKLEER